MSLLAGACTMYDEPPPRYPPDQPYPPGQPYPPDDRYPPDRPYPPSPPYPPGQDAAPLSGSEWRIHAVNGRDTPPGDFFIRFEPDRFSAKLNCNGLGASYEQRGATLDPGALIGTKMACPDMSWETQGSAILERDMMVSWQGPDRVTLSNDRGTILLRRSARRY